jgi:hypothetical protein
MTVAFDDFAFDSSAFDAGTGGAPGYDGKVKKKFIVRKGDRLLVFTKESDALTVLASSNEPQEIPKPEVKAPKRKVVREVIERAEEEVPIQYVQEIAQRQGQDETVQRLLAAAQYAALMSLLTQMQDEEDVEMLLLAA